MMQHQQLSDGRWGELSLVEQMANIGSEVERMIKWRNKGRDTFAQKALLRALELIDLTVDGNLKNVSTLKEILRVRECLIDDFVCENSYGSTDDGWHKYFHAFNYAARISNN